MIEALAKALLDGERCQLIVEKQNDGQITVTVIPQPDMEQADSGMSEQAQQVRASLATPLRISGTPEEIGNNLIRNLAEYGQLRQSLQGYNSAIEKLKAAEEKLKKENAKLEKKAQKKQNESTQKANKKADKEDKASQEESDTAADSGAAKPTEQSTSAPPAPEKHNPGNLFDFS